MNDSVLTDRMTALSYKAGVHCKLICVIRFVLAVQEFLFLVFFTFTACRLLSNEEELRL